VIGGTRVEPLLRDLAPRVLGALVRRYRSFDECEDAVQEALLAAARQWPREGLPENPEGWLVAVASRRLVDEVRSDVARRRREEGAAAVALADERTQAPADEPTRDHDDTLTLLLLCSHPALSPASQIALTLRAVGGLTTAEIAHAFLVPEATMAQRISRAKSTLKASGVPFGPPPAEERDARLAVVRHVLYLIFNEGYTASSGDELARVELTSEAIRLARLLPRDPETAGLLSLMLLTEARRPARTRPDGTLVPLAEQDRTRWNRAMIGEGVALVQDALAADPTGPYQLQAAIAALHDEAPSADETDWRQILALYLVLERVAPNPVVTLNHAVALAQVQGAAAGLELLATLDGDQGLAGQHRLDAVRAHLLERDGQVEAAREHYERAARRTTSVPEQRYLRAQVERLAQPRACG
jgi:RNA polymerase sigma factor (sigma-70 family)